MRFDSLVVLCLASFYSSLSQTEVGIPEPLRRQSFGIRSTQIFASLRSDRAISSECYTYDSTGRLSKKEVYSPDSATLYEYGLFDYNSSGQLASEYQYRKNLDSPTGFLLLRVKSYSYSQGSLLNVRDSFPQAGYADEYKFEYNNQNLERTTQYSRGLLVQTGVYAYAKGRLAKESFFDPGGHLFKYVDYIYRDTTLVESRFFRGAAEPYKVIRYTFDSAGRLITEDHQITNSISSESPHVVRYTY